jgi:Domain of unknown function (DUF4258)
MRQGRYHLSIHALEEMDEDNIGRHDIEHAILFGKIIERQRDRATAEYKYRVLGSTYYGLRMEVVARLDIKVCLVVITVYLL